jgi:hypothetical protein
MITDNTYFKGSIYLSNIFDSGNVEYRVLGDYIERCENEYLEQILGYEMKAEFLSEIADNPTSGIWFDLWKGAEYSYGGRIHKWAGFSNNEKLSPIAYYIYYWYMRNQNSQTTGIGEVVSNVPNNSIGNESVKLMTAWNDMVRFNHKLYDFIYTNLSDYPTFIGMTKENERLYTKINFANI